ncbi:MAG TPA: type II secretion system protein [Candidatus Paceibacterota bacterium]|nr:type II secretion system protein [Candidatus Paceibacterota bacterium]
MPLSCVGFTLIETLVTIALTTIVMVALTFLIQYFYQTNAYALEETQAIDSARLSIEHTVADLREASYGADGSYPIAAAATSTVTFYADVDADGTVEKVRYYLSGSTLYRGATEPATSSPSYAGQPEATTLVVDNIRNGTSTPLFTYFGANGTQLAEPVDAGQVASVRIDIRTDINPNRAPAIYTLVGGATLRNLHDQFVQ